MSHQEFIQIWNASSSAVDAASKTGMAPHSASVRAFKLRQQGFNLQKFEAKKPLRSINDRFDSMVQKYESGCWVWIGSKDPKGYGKISQHKRGLRPLQAHRVSYERFTGPITDGLCVLHRCDNPSCVNPDHLFLGTEYENTQDMIRKGRGWWQKQNRITWTNDLVDQLLEGVC